MAFDAAQHVYVQIVTFDAVCFDLGLVQLGVVQAA